LLLRRCLPRRGLAGVEGNGNNCFPFGISCNSLSSERYQQVYAASQFGSGGLITQIAFRPDASAGLPFSSATIGNIRIDLSSTSAAPDGLSSAFASNVGANDIIVFSGSLSLSSAFAGPVGGPKAFDITINLTTPFLYTPGLGNLLLDVRNFSGSPDISSFDAESTVGDSTSRIFTNDVNGVGDAIGNADTLGLVTQFTIVNTPEPGTFGLLALGALAMAGRMRLKTKR
jgi:hypothetical protein